MFSSRLNSNLDLTEDINQSDEIFSYKKEFYMSVAKIFFWNSGLAYSNSTQPKEEDIKNALDIIEYIMNEKEGDLLILCEVNSYTYEIFKRKLPKFEINNLTNKASTRSYFDMISISNKNINIKEIIYIVKNDLSEEQDKIEKDRTFIPNSGKTMKVGIDITVKINNISNDFNLIASHWPSKINGFSEDSRNECGEELKIYTKELIGNKRQVILIGDYNDSPESISIIHKLGSVNNRYYASLDRNRIYNPSFGFFVPHKLYYKGEERSFYGTWLSKCDNTRKHNKHSCQVFDQVMVTSSFINSGPWNLDEENTKVISDEKIMHLLYNRVIDHLPIMITVCHLLQIEGKKNEHL